MSDTDKTNLLRLAMGTEKPLPFSIPTCDSCSKPAVVQQAYSGRVLCGEHLCQMNRKKISKELRKQLVLKGKGQKTNIFVAISGGKDSAVLLESLVDILGKRPDIEITAGCVDEGIEGYRPPSLECARRLCEKLGVKFLTVPYTELGFVEMDEVARRLPMVTQQNKSASKMPCAYCGVFRRQGINHLAQLANADVIALGHNLDDMAQTVMMNITNGDLERTIRLAPHTARPAEGMAPRIVPLRWIPEQEIHLMAVHKELEIHHEECPHAQGALRWRTRDIVADLERDSPGTRHGLLKMADQIKSMRAQLDEAIGKSSSPMPNPTSCPTCGEMTSSATECRACQMKVDLGIV